MRFDPIDGRLWDCSIVVSSEALVSRLFLGSWVIHDLDCSLGLSCLEVCSIPPRFFRSWREACCALSCGFRPEVDSSHIMLRQKQLHGQQSNVGSVSRGCKPCMDSLLRLTRDWNVRNVDSSSFRNTVVVALAFSFPHRPFRYPLDWPIF